MVNLQKVNLNIKWPQRLWLTFGNGPLIQESSKSNAGDFSSGELHRASLLAKLANIKKLIQLFMNLTKKTLAFAAASLMKKKKFYYIDN